MKPFEKFGHTHTCTCGNSPRYDNKPEVIGADFKHKRSEGFKGYLWHKSNCLKCGGTVLHGSSYADFRIQGEGLLLSAIRECANDFSYQTFNLLTEQFYNGKHFQSKFIKRRS